MPKLRKEDVADLDVDELEEAEYTEGSGTRYDGEIPPADTVLTGYVKSIWWTRTANNDPMLKVLWVADENVGDLEDYNGLPAWENMALTTGAKFKWAPFFEHFGISIRDIKVDKTGKSRTVLAAEDDSMGAPVEKIGDFEPGSDESWCRISTTREKYDGQWRAHVGQWLDYEEPDDEEADEEPEVDEDEVEEDAEEEADDTEEEEAAPPARGRRTAAKASRTPAATPPRSTARKPAPSRSAPAKAAAAKAPARGKGRRAAGSSDDPPF